MDRSRSELAELTNNVEVNQICRLGGPLNMTGHLVIGCPANIQGGI